jgi:hypothetical protein
MLQLRSLHSRKLVPSATVRVVCPHFSPPSLKSGFCALSYSSARLTELPLTVWWRKLVPDVLSNCERPGHMQRSLETPHKQASFKYNKEIACWNILST